MELTYNDEARTFTLHRENGTVDLTMNEVGFIVNQFGKMNLRSNIIDRINSANDDWLDVSKYPYSFEELVDEIFVDLEDEIDYGNSVSDEDIDDKISDLCSYYELERD